MATRRVTVRQGAAQLERLRALRVPTPALELGPVLDRVVRELGHAGRGDSAAEQAWNTVAPESIRTRARPMRLARGVLTIKAEDRAVAYLVDRWCRAQGRAALAKAMGRGVTRVHVLV